MAVSLTKGQKVSLSKEKAGLDKVVIGLGWDAKAEKKVVFYHLCFHQHQILTAMHQYSCLKMIN